MAETEL
jgi:hypothetical protein